MVRTPRRRGEAAAMPARLTRSRALGGHQVTDPSEIPCRVSNLPCAEATPCDQPAHNGEAHTGRLRKEGAMAGG